MVILAPLLAPVAQTLGIDLVHFGVIMMANLAIGMMTPPVGVNLYVVCDTAKVKINVTGGAFKGVIAKDEDNSTIAITGGIYYSYVHNQEDLAKFVPEGSEIIFDGISDGVQVKPKNTTIVIIQPTEDKPAEDQKNPSTGANDFVGIAAAMAIVSVVGAAAVSRKK